MCKGVNKNFSTKYNIKDAWFVNEIITKGSNTISVRVSKCNYHIYIYIGNDIETLKEFCLKEIL